MVLTQAGHSCAWKTCSTRLGLRICQCNRNDCRHEDRLGAPDQLERCGDEGAVGADSNGQMEYSVKTALSKILLFVLLIIAKKIQKYCIFKQYSLTISPCEATLLQQHHKATKVAESVQTSALNTRESRPLVSVSSYNRAHEEQHIT